MYFFFYIFKSIQKIFTNDYSRKSILFVAKDSFEEKGGKDLLDAFENVKKEIHNCKLKIVGQKIPIKIKGVENIGFIDKNKPKGKENLRKLFQEASLFVMPSYVEATSNVFLEAMSNGLPCIGANLSAMPELILGNNCGLVSDPGNIKDLSRKIISILKDENSLRTFGENGRIAVEKKYNWDIVCKKAVDVISRYI
jgi:glycosyltransferase involved in cell wall biosynthesis